MGLMRESMDDQTFADIHGVFEQMDELHPTADHWYLPLTGVDPRAQGWGLGSRLLRHALAICDRDRLPAYLEATSPAITTSTLATDLPSSRSYRPGHPRRCGRCSASPSRSPEADRSVVCERPAQRWPVPASQLLGVLNPIARGASHRPTVYGRLDFVGCAGAGGPRRIRSRAASTEPRNQPSFSIHHVRPTASKGASRPGSTPDD